MYFCNIKYTSLLFYILYITHASGLRLSQPRPNYPSTLKYERGLNHQSYLQCRLVIVYDYQLDLNTGPTPKFLDPILYL